MILPRSFYQRDTVTVAKELLGKYFLCATAAGVAVGKIVETEAYLAGRDQASHAFKGKTPRTAVLFDEPGKLYVYFIYGMHYCANVVANEAGLGEAVLFRAVEPVIGVELMRQRRKSVPLAQVTNGPAKMVQALGIQFEDNGRWVTEKTLNIQDEIPELGLEKTVLKPQEVVTTTRIGISKAQGLPLRFYLKNNHFVSKY